MMVRETQLTSAVVSSLKLAFAALFRLKGLCPDTDKLMLARRRLTDGLINKAKLAAGLGDLNALIKSDCTGYGELLSPLEAAYAGLPESLDEIPVSQGEATLVLQGKLLAFARVCPGELVAADIEAILAALSGLDQLICERLAVHQRVALAA